jgi:hypothetical protein
VNFGDWLDSRRPPPPIALRERLQAVANPAMTSSAPDPGALIETAEHLLASLLRNNASRRERALDLLAADALVTYAFEAAAEDASNLEGLTSDAMRRLSAVATTP